MLREELKKSICGFDGNATSSKINSFINDEILPSAEESVAAESLAEMVRAFLAATSHYQKDFGRECAVIYKKRERKQLGKQGVQGFIK